MRSLAVGTKARLQLISVEAHCLLEATAGTGTERLQLKLLLTLDLLLEVARAPEMAARRIEVSAEGQCMRVCYNIASERASRSVSAPINWEVHYAIGDSEFWKPCICERPVYQRT